MVSEGRKGPRGFLSFPDSKADYYQAAEASTDAKHK